jgi:hypothetical protein
VVAVDDVAQVLISDRFSISQQLADAHQLDPAFVALTKFKVQFPRDVHKIIGHSATPWDNNLILRYYLDQGAGMIQVMTDRKGMLLGPTVEFFSLFSEQRPSDLSLWLPVPGAEARQNTWWVGNAAYPLPNIPLDDHGHWAQWAYRRSWVPDPSRHAIAPRVLNEAIRQEQGGARVIEHQMMAYHRPPAAMVLQGEVPAYGLVADQSLCEQMILTADSEAGGTVIRCWVGVEVLPQDLRL